MTLWILFCRMSKDMDTLFTLIVIPHIQHGCI